MFRREKEMGYICRMFKMENEHHLWSGPPLPDAELLHVPTPSCCCRCTQQQETALSI